METDHRMLEGLVILHLHLTGPLIGGLGYKINSVNTGLFSSAYQWNVQSALLLCREAIHWQDTASQRRCVELGKWSIENQLGSTNGKGLPVLFQGSHQGCSQMSSHTVH